MKTCKRCLTVLVLLSLLLACTCAADGTPIVLSAVGNSACVNGNYLPLEGEDEVTFSEGLCAVRIGELWGYINTAGKLVIEPAFDAAGAFSESRALVESGQRRFCIDASGQEVLDVSAYDAACAFSDGLARVQSGGLWGYIATDGTLKIEPQFEQARDASENLLCVCKDGLWGYIHPDGTVAVDFAYDYAEDFSEGAAYVEADGAGLLIGPDGTVLAENVYSGLSDGLALTAQEGLWGFVDAAGEIVIPCEFSDAEPARDGMVRVCTEGLWGFADVSGAVVIEPAWDYVWPFSDGYALYADFDDFGQNVRYGYIDRHGNAVTDAVYERAMPFSDGCAAVYDGEQWGYIDGMGEPVLDCAYDYAGSFTDGLAVVAVGERYALIAPDGGELVIHYPGEDIGEPQEDTPAEETPHEEEEPKGTVSVGALIVLVVTVALILFIAGTSLMRSVNIRRRRRERRARREQQLAEKDDRYDRD